MRKDPQKQLELVLKVGMHRGDLEMIQLALDALRERKRERTGAKGETQAA